jgi:hypothetical protein
VGKVTARTKAIIAAGVAFAAGLSALLTNVGSICDRLGIAFCIEDVEQSAAIGTIKLEQQVTYGEFVARMPPGPRALTAADETPGIVALAQVTVKGYEGDRIVITPVLQRMPGGQRVPDIAVEPQSFAPRAATASRSVELWVQAPSQRGSYVIKVEVEDTSGAVLAFMDTPSVEWPLPITPVEVPTPPRPVTGPYEEQYASERETRPPRRDEAGYWARTSFRYLGDPACEEGGRDFPCYLPLRTAPDFRDSVGRPITRRWPVDGRDWVWVVCQADGNGIENEGLLTNSQGTKSNRWNLISLGRGKNGIRRYAWGNDIWFLPKGPLAPDGTPKFPCGNTDSLAQVHALHPGLV